MSETLTTSKTSFSCCSSLAGDALLVVDRLTPYGLRQVHVMRPGARVERERWLGMVPILAAAGLRVLEYEERELGVWHLRLFWPAREMVGLGHPEAAGIGQVALWHLAPGERLRDAIEGAAFLYLAETEQFPDTAWCGTYPAGAPKELVLGDGFALKIEYAEWIPRLCVAVGMRPK